MIRPEDVRYATSTALCEWCHEPIYEGDAVMLIAGEWVHCRPCADESMLFEALAEEER